MPDAICLHSIHAMGLVPTEQQVKRLYIFSATKQPLNNHRLNFMPVVDAYMESGELKVGQAGTPYEEGDKLVIVTSSGTMQVDPADLGFEDETYWIKVWPDRKWYRVTNDNTPSASHLHP